MSHYLILVEDQSGAFEARLAHRQAHLHYWKAKAPAVQVAGAMLDGDRPRGSALLVEAADEAEARALLAGDPFTTAGVFSEQAQVIAVRPAIGDWLP